MLTAGITIRNARLEDKQDIGAIGKIYNGFDYLDDLYYIMMQDSNLKHAVALDDGVIVGYSQVRVNITQCIRGSKQGTKPNAL